MPSSGSHRPLKPDWRKPMRATLCFAFVSCMLTVGIVAGAARPRAQQKAPIPDAAAQESVRRAAGEVYGDRFRQAKRATAKTALAKEILDAASRVREGSADQYVLLEIARDIAAGAGDAPTALAVMDKLAGAFAVPVAKTKAETLLSTARGASFSTQHKAVAEAAFKVLDDLTAAEEFDTAKRLCETALASARRAKEYPLARELAARARRLQQQEKALREYREALAVLEKEPGDPAANLAAGRYLCLVKNDWNRGVPMLALGSDAELKELAIKDLKGAPTAEAQAALGDDWSALADKKKGPEKESLMRRAEIWYRRAQPRLAGVARLKVDTRLEQIAGAGRKTPEPFRGLPLAIAPFDAMKARDFQARCAKHLRVPVVQTNSIGTKFVLIPPGEFEMGSTKEEVQRLLDESRREATKWAEKLSHWYVNHALVAEAPRHHVKITKPFLLGMYEVTQAEYERVMGNNPSRFKGDPTLPVEMVDWDKAAEFCRKLNELPKEKAARVVYRLPTEAEWEYACRAGTTTRYSFGDDAAGLSQYAWWMESCGGRTHPVGRLRPNAWGLFDMHGNVSEWCSDWHDASYYAKSPTDDPTGPATGSIRVGRGGAWVHNAGYCRSAVRNLYEAGYRRYRLGFRVAATLSP